MKTWFISDTHFGHANIIKLANRPFANVTEMDETIIARWNEVVSDGDIVYHLGDFSWGSHRPTLLRYFERLKGEKHLIRGNHDHSACASLPWASCRDMLGLTADNGFWILCHYPLREWPGFFRGAFHLYGHVHGTLLPYGRSLDMSVECHDYRPVALETLKERLKTIKPGHPA